MPIVIIMLAAAYFSKTTIIAFICILVMLKLIARGRSSCLTFHYDKDNKLYKEFIEKTDIANLKYEPHLFGPTPGPQGFIYITMETLFKFCWPDKFDREILTLPDGGTIGLDWDKGIPNPN